MSPSRSNGAFVLLIAASIAVGQLGVSLYLPRNAELSVVAYVSSYSAMALIMFLFVTLALANIHRILRSR